VSDLPHIATRERGAGARPAPVGTRVAQRVSNRFLGVEPWAGPGDRVLLLGRARNEEE